MQSVRSGLRFLADLVGALLLAAMFAAFLVQVFARYVLNDPISWTQEFVLIVYIWIVFWGGAFLVRERDHIAFDMIFEGLALPARRILAVVLTGLIGIAFLAALPGTVDYIAFMAIEKSPIMRVPFDILYSIFGVFMVAVVAMAGLRIKRLAGRRWQEELARNAGEEP